MKKLCLTFALIISSAFAMAANPTAIIKTTEGDITLELAQDKAPLSVANFIAYANDGYYNGTIFHRVIPGFMIQGGGLTKKMMKKKTKAPIRNEANNGLFNNSGTVAMARTNDPHSATSQFFINVKDNRSLNYSSYNMGYAVFAKVINGMDVVKNIEMKRTTNKAGHSDVPVKNIVIESVVIQMNKAQSK